MSKPGSVDINPFSIFSSLYCTRLYPLRRGGDGGKKPHNVGNLTRTYGVGALDNQSAVATPPIVHHDFPYMCQSSNRSAQVLGSTNAALVAGPLGHPPPPLASSGVDQLQVPGSGPLDSASSALSPNSLLFPLPLSAVSASSLPDLPPPTSFSFASASSFASALPSSSCSFTLSSFPPLPSFTPSSLSSASFPSSSSVNSALPPSVSSLLPSSLSFPPSGSSSSSSSFPPSFSEASSSSVPPPPGFLPHPMPLVLLFFLTLSLPRRFPRPLFRFTLSFLLLLPLPPLSWGHFLLPLWQTTRLGCKVSLLLTSRWLVGSSVRVVQILRVLCALPFLIFFLILYGISPLAPPFSWLLFALPLPPLLLRTLFPLPPLRLLLCPLTCPLLRRLGCLLAPLLLLLRLYLTLLLLLRLLLLLASFRLLLHRLLSCLLHQLPLLPLSQLLLLLLSLLPFLSWVQRLYLGLVWVSLLLLGFPLSLFIHLFPRLVLPRPLLGCPLPPSSMIRMRFPLLRPLLILSMTLMTASRMTIILRLTLRLPRSRWTPLTRNIVTWWSMYLVCSRMQRVFRRLRHCLALYSNLSSLLLRPLPSPYCLAGSKGFALPWLRRTLVWLACWLRGVRNASFCHSVQRLILFGGGSVPLVGRFRSMSRYWHTSNTLCARHYSSGLLSSTQWL